MRPIGASILHLDRHPDDRGRMTDELEGAVRRCGRRGRRDRATVVRVTVPGRATPLHCKPRPERSGVPAKWVGAPSKRGTMTDHGQRSILFNLLGPMAIRRIRQQREASKSV